MAVVAALLAASAFAPAAGAVQTRPNVIVVMTDDQTVSQLTPKTMPATWNLLAKAGTRFTDSFVTSPLCCPSRAGFLTGSYVHNHRVFDNVPGYSTLAEPRSTIYTWLKSAGYRTGHIGRFLLGYPRAQGTLGGLLPPPGVDEWFGYLGSTTRYYDAYFSDHGLPFLTGSEYATAVINREAREFIANAAPSDQPFFLSVAHLAPHTVNSQPRGACGRGTPVPAPSAYERFAQAPLPKSPSFNEKRISDKPRWVRKRRRISQEKLELLREGWRCALASLTTVDRGVAELVATLEATGELDRTAIFFTSDNGLLFGEHRIVQAKGFPYEEVIRVPLLARVPAAFRGTKAPQPRRVTRRVTNIDLTATILALAGTRPCAAGGCRTIDGRSFLPLLRKGDAARWPKGRATLIELGAPNCARVPGAPGGLPVFYSAIRTRTHFYARVHSVNRATGKCEPVERELYDLRADPYQLDNVAKPPARATKVQRKLARRLSKLTRCAGIENRDPRTAGRPYCE